MQKNTNTFQILAAAGIMIAGTLYSCSNGLGDGFENQHKPNVLFILTYDLGRYDLSCMGNEYYGTPNIDRIETKGSFLQTDMISARFAARHGQVSCPANFRHGTVLPTGLVPLREKNGEKPEGSINCYLRDMYTNLAIEYLSLPEALKEVGYKTFFVEKWHLGEKGTPG